MASRNPFTPSFGQVPPHMAGRTAVIEELSEAFENGPGDPNLSSIFVGARGTGKTALLSLAAEKALERGWVSASVSALPGMLDDILQRAVEGASEFIEPEAARHVSGIQVGQLLGVEWERDEPAPANWRTRMNALFRALDAHDVGLLITVDEVRVELDEMVQLASVYQHFVREGRKVSLLMAGLPANVSGLLNDASVSFLRRARQHHLGRIPDFEIEDALLMTIEGAGRSIGPAALRDAVAAHMRLPTSCIMEGKPLMQLVGYRMWAASPEADEISRADVARGVGLAREEMRSGVFESTVRELSEGDLRYLRAMLPDEGDSRTSDIAARMGVSGNYAAQYRRRLLEQGVIGERGRGRVGFDLPAFRDYLREREGLG